MTKSNDRRNMSNRRRKKKNIAPYAVVVASVGVVAFSVAGFQIYSKVMSSNQIMKPIESSSSQVNESQGNDDIIQDAVSADNTSSNSNDDNISEATENIFVPEINEYEVLHSKKDTVNSYKPMLTGSELDLLLTKRTGVSSEGIIVGEPETDDENEADDNSSQTEETGASSAPNATNTNVTGDSQIGMTTLTPSKVTEDDKPIIPEFVASNMPSSGAENINYWKNINSDVIGYIKIPNTNISYPVVVGPDNLYYEHKDYYKKESQNGVIWADSDTKFGNRNQISKNTVIYGHNWTNCTNNPFIGRDTDVMFAQLTQFQHYDFAKESPYIYYSTENEEMVWKIFAVLYSELEWNCFRSDGTNSYMSSLITEAKARSLHNYDVDVNAYDKIITLPTCTRAYGKRSDQRFVVMARLLRNGESIADVNITPNPDFIPPKLK